MRCWAAEGTEWRTAIVFVRLFSVGLAHRFVYHPDRLIQREKDILVMQ